MRYAGSERSTCYVLYVVNGGKNQRLKICDSQSGQPSVYHDPNLKCVLPYYMKINIEVFNGLEINTK